MFVGWVGVILDSPVGQLDYSPLMKLRKEFWPVLVTDHGRYFNYLYRPSPGPSCEERPVVAPSDGLGDIVLTPITSPVVEDFCVSPLGMEPQAMRDFLYN